MQGVSGKTERAPRPDHNLPVFRKQEEEGIRDNKAHFLRVSQRVDNHLPESSAQEREMSQKRKIQQLRSSGIFYEGGQSRQSESEALQRLEAVAHDSFPKDRANEVIRRRDNTFTDLNNRCSGRDQEQR